MQQGQIRHEEDPQHHGPQQQGGQVASVFEMINQKLLALGVPRWNLGETTIEPVVSVGVLLIGLIFGLKGLLFAGVLFFISKMSRRPGGIMGFFGMGGGGRPRPRGRGPGQNRPQGGSGGYSLGR